MTPEELKKLIAERGLVQKGVSEETTELKRRIAEQGVIQTPLLQNPMPRKGTTEEISVLGDVFKGIVSGTLIGIPEGIATLGFGLYDALADDDTLRDLDAFTGSLRDRLGLNVETQAGEIAELAGLFATTSIPVVGWMSRASLAARGIRAIGTATTRFGKSAEKFGSSPAGKALLAGEGAGPVTRRLYDVKRGLVTSGATATADFMVAPDGVSTMSDHFDALPDFLETEEDMGFTGRDEVARRMRNKLRIAGESFGIGAAVDFAMPVAGAAIGGAGVIASPVIAPITATIGRGFDILAEQADKIPVLNTTNFKKYFTTAGLLEKELSEQILDTGSDITAQAKVGAKLLSSYDKEVRNTIGSMPLFGKGKEQYQAAYDDLIKYLDGDLKALDGYEDTVRNAARKMAAARNNLSEQIYEQLSTAYKNGDIKPDPVTGRTAEQVYADLRRAFEQREGAYLRRMYTGGIDRKNLKSVMKTDKFKTAVDEVEEAVRRHGSQEIKDLEKDGLLRQYAEQYVMDNIVKDRVGITERTSLDGLTRAGTENLEKQIDKSARANAAGARFLGEAVPIYKFSEDLLKSRSAILEASPMLRELMGEVKSGRDAAVSRYMQTITDMAGLAGSSKLYNELLSNSSITGTADDVIKALDQGNTTPMILRNEDMELLRAQSPEVAERLSKLYVEVPAAQRSVFGGQFGALGGNHVRKELFDALTTRPIARTALGNLWALGIQAKGVSQISKTVFSTMAQARNYASGVFFGTANGHMPRAGDIFDAFNVSAAKMANMREQDFLDFYQLAMRTGLLEDSVLVKEMQDTLRGTLREAEKGGKRVISFTERLTDAAKKIPGAEAAAKTAGAPIKGLQTSYAFADNLWKMNAFISERARYAAALRNSALDETGVASIKASDWDLIADDLVAQGVAKRTSNIHGDKFFDVWTSDIVKDTMPVYSRIPKIAKMAARFPLAGNFVGFSAEIIRNSFNIVRQGAAEVSFRATDDIIAKIGPQAAKRLQREINAIGAKRLTGYVTTAAGVSPAIAAGASAALGLTKEERESLDVLKPYFYEGQVMVPLTKPKDGKIQYMPISYYAPYDSAVAPAKAALEAYSRGESLGKGEIENIANGAFTFISKLAQPFTEEALLSERVADVVSVAGFGRGGRRRTGAEVYDPADDGYEKMVKSMRHILGAMNPSIIDNFLTVRADRGVVPGKITRSITGVPTAYGKDYNLYEEIMANTLGARSLTLDANEQIKFSSSEYAKFRNAGPVPSLNKMVRANDASEEDIISAWIDSNEDLFRLQQDLYLDFEAAKNLGVSTKSIKRAAKERNVGSDDIKQILKGKFQPLSIGYSLIEDARQEERDGQGRVVPARNLQRLRKSLNRISKRQLDNVRLDEPFPMFTDPEQPEPLSLNVPQTPNVPVLSQPLSSPITPTAAPLPAATGPQTSINPELLGDNPIEQARNLELARRTRTV